ncbi:50S ribosomal protein L31e [uncultured archaeon]|nr:50S ribosomal protein L31e [uncultured archaeon]
MEKEKNNRIEREYVIPLRTRWKIVPTYKRANKAVKTIKEFLVKHMKIRDRDLDKVRVDKYLNEAIWSRGIKNPPAKIKVKAIKEDDIVRVELAEMPAKIKFKKLREEKQNSKSQETKKKKKEAEEKTEEKTEAKTEEEKIEEKEDKSATIEAGKEIEKEIAQKAKHETKVKSPKEQKNMKSTYNRMSQGH